MWMCGPSVGCAIATQVRSDDVWSRESQIRARGGGGHGSAVLMSCWVSDSGEAEKSVVRWGKG